MTSSAAGVSAISVSAWRQRLSANGSLSNYREVINESNVCIIRLTISMMTDGGVAVDVAG